MSGLVLRVSGGAESIVEMAGKRLGEEKGHVRYFWDSATDCVELVAILEGESGMRNYGPCSMHAGKFSPPQIVDLSL